MHFNSTNIVVIVQEKQFSASSTPVYQLEIIFS